MNAVIYARFSSERQREESIEGQLRECQEYAKRNDINIINTYIDRALSASKDTDKRLDFLRMIQDSSKKLFDAVLVWKLDRFSRDRYDHAHYKRILKKNGVKVISATENISDGPEGIILESLLEGMAEYYSAELSEKIHRGQKENALKGKNNGGSIPLGYRLGTDQRLEIDPLTAPVVQEIFRRYAAGESTKDIRDDLNSRGIKTARNNRFTYSSFETILKNRKYIGEYRYQDVVLENSIPRIISDDIFNLVQAKLKRNKATPAAGKAEERYLLTTKLFCGKCGNSMIGESGVGRHKRVYRYYKCLASKRKKSCSKKPVKKEWIKDFVVRHTLNMVMNEKLINDLTDQIMKLQKTDNYTLRLLQQQLAEIDKKLNNLMAAIEQGIITATTKQRMIALEEEKATVEQNILHEQITHPILTREQILDFLHQFKHSDICNDNDRQRLIEYFVNAVYVYDDHLLLTFNYRNGSKKVKFNDIIGSDMDGCSPPKRQVNTCLFSFYVRVRPLTLRYFNHSAAAGTGPSAPVRSAVRVRYRSPRGR